MEEKEKWALVTGASAGVGREIVLNLASKGYNLVLVARSSEKLDALKNEIRSNYNIFAESCVADLSCAESVDSVIKFCDDAQIVVDLLVNNAGVGLFGESVELKDDVLAMINLNVIALTRLCASFGALMKARKSGSILNIGSIAGNQPTAYFASYAATKSYVLNYSLALRHELAPYKVNVTCVQPGYIRTAFDDACKITSEKYKKFSYKNGMSAREVSDIAVKAVLKKRSYVRTGFSNKLVSFFSGFIPRNFLAWCLAVSVRAMTKTK
ncbi:MAG: SDR family oxidoreductase [Treponema sp.]|nr:SDR family oxidoreductase [Treponema sp.]